MCIDVYKGDDNFVTSGATLLSDLDLQETYKAIDSVATGGIPSLFCVITVTTYCNQLEHDQCLWCPRLFFSFLYVEAIIRN